MVEKLTRVGIPTLEIGKFLRLCLIASFQNKRKKALSFVKKVLMRFRQYEAGVRRYGHQTSALSVLDTGVVEDTVMVLPPASVRATLGPRVVPPREQVVWEPVYFPRKKRKKIRSFS